VIEVKISVDGHGDDGGSFTRLTRRATDPARAVALALIGIAEYVRSPKLMEIAEAAHRITREDQS
jgi:hypothetical protein